MSISSIAGVAVGLVFVYLLLSLMCTAAKEILELVLRKRSADLEAGIRELLNDPAGTGLAKDVFEHPLVFSLFRGDYKPAPHWSRFITRQESWAEYFSNCSLSELPAYIPSANFAIALMDVVLHPDSVPPVVTSRTPTPTSTVIATQPVPSRATATSNNPAPIPVPTLAETIEAIPNTQVRRALLTMSRDVENDEAQLRGRVEVWFNSAMDRVSGEYKRWSQTILLGLGVLISVGLNVDTIAIVNGLSQDPAQVQKILTAATTYLATKSSNAGTDPGKLLQLEMSSLQGTGLPIGWYSKSIPEPDDYWGWTRKIGGLFLTSLAVSMGAPFWFDVLDQFMVVRSTGKPRSMS